MNRLPLLFVLGLFCCSGQQAKTLETHKSPTGQYSLLIDQGNRDNLGEKYILMFKLTDTDGKELDYVRTEASSVQKWAVTWYTEKIVILNGSDFGKTYAWTVGDNGKLLGGSVTYDMMTKGEETFKKKYGYGFKH
jgi:hypothetical protein